MERSGGYSACKLDRLYWDVVEATMTKVYGADPGTARERVARLVDEFSTLSPADLEFAFHAEPLSVAADLMQRDRVTQRDSELYGRLAERERWIYEAQSEPALQLSHF